MEIVSVQMFRFSVCASFRNELFSKNSVISTLDCICYLVVTSIFTVCQQTKAKIDIPGMTTGYHKVRVNFPREITERKAVKEVIVSTYAICLCILVSNIFVSC